MELPSSVYFGAARKIPPKSQFPPKVMSDLGKIANVIVVQNHLLLGGDI